MRSFSLTLVLFLSACSPLDLGNLALNAVLIISDVVGEPNNE